MKLPVKAPAILKLMADKESIEGVFRQRQVIGPELDGDYIHWDRLRHRTPPSGLSHEAWWLGIKLARQARAIVLPFREKSGTLFKVSITDSMLRNLHLLDRQAAGRILGAGALDADSLKAKYLHRSLVEEAMTSSQLEGASTTRRVAKEMLDSGREPRDRSEQMIYNNFATMQALAEWKDQPLSPEMLLDIHRRITDAAMDDPQESGRFRRAEDDIVVYDRSDPSRILHTPPLASELPERIQTLCDFANGSGASEPFLHPVVRAIVLHFMVGYDHPFCDGNGRTARALFYWSMLKSGYWLSEYFSISTVLKRSPGAYLQAYLYSESDEGDASYFVAHQLRVIMTAISQLEAYIGRKTAELRQAQAQLGPTNGLGATLNHRQREILMQLLAKPDSRISIAAHQKRQGVTYATARADLLGLEALGLLLRHQEGKRFEFEAVMDLPARVRLGK
ncbi:filamentation induced by cAMP protein fic [Lysobacteraceae bacterium NML91-0268]|nr:filamentation induced by cAMP protein fic [Xanthomonadaceae bacterium NML91-0268]